MDVKTIIDVDLARPYPPTIVYAKQLDRLSRYITVRLRSNGTVFSPPAGAAFEVRGVKPDGTVVAYTKDESGAAAVTVVGGLLTVSIAQQALAVPGDVGMEVSITSSGSTLTTFAWTLRVEASAVSGVQSTNYINPAIASVASAHIDAVGHLILTMSTGSTIDAGLAKGANGAKGADGKDGADGADGITPTIGANGNWYLGDTDTGKPSRGERGATGQTGATPVIGDDGTWVVGSVHTGKPSRGADGVTPSIGDNGNWYLGDTDTGKPSRGETGKGLDVLGTYTDLASLSAAVTSPAQGDIYNVGDSAPYTLYMWDNTTPPGAWLSLGKLQGPTGAQGAAGEPGSMWYTGTAVGGFFQGARQFAESGIDYARAGDLYLNTGADAYVYTCTVSGAPDTAYWRLLTSIRGAKGDKGDTGDTGAAGHTPVRGTDYWTAEDKAEIVSAALAALPTWTGGDY